MAIESHRDIQRAGNSAFAGGSGAVPRTYRSRLDGVGNSLTASNSSFPWRVVNQSGGRFEQGNNFGVGGATSGSILAAIATYVASPNKTVLYCEGTNDANAAISDATHASNTLAILNAFIGAGKSIILALAPPRDTAVVACQNINVIDWYIGRALGLHVVNPWLHTIDLATGAYAAGISTDGVHPNHDALSAAGYEVIRSLACGQPHIPLPQSNVDGGAYALNTNPMFLTDTNSDGTPDGWTRSGDGTVSLVSGGRRGNWMRVAQAGGTAITQVYRDFAVAGNTEVLLVLRLKTQIGANCRYDIYLNDNNGSGGPNRTYVAQLESDSQDERVVYVRRTVLSNLTALRLIIQVVPISAGAFTGEVSVAQVQIYNLTALQALTGLPCGEELISSGWSSKGVRRHYGTTAPDPNDYDEWVYTTTGRVRRHDGQAWFEEPGVAGANGSSAYQIAVANGFVGTESAWLTSLIGAAGASAYAIAVANGFVGDVVAWLASLQGADGAAGDGAWQERRLIATQALTNNTTMQDWFTSAGGLVLDPSSTYEFEGTFISLNGATSHGLNMQFAAISGGAIQWNAIGVKAVAATQATAQRAVATDTFATPRNVTTASTVAGNMVRVWGTVRTGAGGGTLRPQVSQTSASGSFTVQPGTFLKARRVGADTLVNTGGWT